MYETIDAEIIPESIPDPRPQVGASAGASASNQPAAEELPMMVWLRGDEPICAEFSLDADEVMQRLGIRRSRLTQISGKELRVGRMRKGRYVSPVFRPVDVDAYLGWTRASASHLKSSGLLHDAAEELTQQSERLSTRLEAVPQELAETMGQQIAAATAELSDLVQAEVGGLKQGFARLEAATHVQQEHLSEQVKNQAQQLEALTQQLVEQQQRLQVMALELIELAALTRRRHVDALDYHQAELAEQQRLAAVLASDRKSTLASITAIAASVQTARQPQRPPSRATARRLQQAAASDRAKPTPRPKPPGRVGRANGSRRPPTR